MMNDDRSDAATDSATGGPNIINETIRVMRIVRRKLPTLAICMTVGAVLGVVWYVTATRKYDSTSEIMVLKTESNVLEGNNSSNQRTIQDLMPTYQRVFTQDKVLERAIARLPREHRIDLKGVPKSRWITELKRNISVTTTRQTSMLSVRYVSKNPKTAAFVVGAIVDSYLEFMRDIHKGSSKENLELLSNQKEQLEADLVEKEQQLLSLKQSSGIMLQGGSKDTHIVVQRTLKMNETLAAAQGKTFEARALLQSVQNALATGADIQPFLQQVAGDVSRELMSRELGLGSGDANSIAKREEDLADDESELRTQLRMYGPNHPQVIQLKDRIEQSQKWLSERQQIVAAAMKQIREQDLGPKLLQMVEQHLFQARAHESTIRQEFELIQAEAMGLNGQLAEIESLEAVLKRTRDYHDLILDKIAHIDIGANSGLKTVLTTPAQVNSTPVAPKISTTILLCIVLGGIVGVGIIYVMDALDDRFRSPDEVQWQLGLPMLAMIREMQPLTGSGLDSIVTFAKPDSLESESFRTLRSSITFSAAETRRLVVTSTEPGDGKTTTLANLAVAFAQAKKKTLLIDADLRRPGMTQLLDLKGPRGLSHILRDSKPVGESCLENIFNLGIENLDVMPSGPRPANPSELLASERFNDIIAWAEAIYDQILIDAPPVLAVTDPAIIGRVVDGAVVVIRPDKNRRKLVLRAIESYRATGVNVIGIVANHIAEDGGGEYGFGYGYGYGYGYGHGESPEVGADQVVESFDEPRIAA